MSRTIPLLLALGFLTFTPPSFAQETSSVWQYLGQRATRLAAQLPPLPTSAEDWDKQRTDLTTRLRATLGLPNREPMQATVISSKPTGDLASDFAYIVAAPKKQGDASADVQRLRESHV